MKCLCYSSQAPPDRVIWAVDLLYHSYEVVIVMLMETSFMNLSAGRFDCVNKSHRGMLWTRRYLLLCRVHTHSFFSKPSQGSGTNAITQLTNWVPFIAASERERKRERERACPWLGGIAGESSEDVLNLHVGSGEAARQLRINQQLVGLLAM